LQRAVDAHANGAEEQVAELLDSDAQGLAGALEAAATVPLHQVDVQVRLGAPLEELVGADPRMAVGRLLGVLAQGLADLGHAARLGLSNQRDEYRHSTHFLAWL